MTMTAAQPGRIDFGQVFQGTFAVVGRNPLVFGLIALLLIGVPYAVLGLLWPQPVLTLSALGAYYARTGVMLVVITATSAVAQAAIIHGVVADLNGRKAGAGECLSAGLSQALPVFLVGLLLGLAILVGLVLLIVPGIIVALMFSAAVPAQVVERTGIIAAFRRSAELTRDNRGTIFLVGLVVSILMGVAGAIVGGVIGAVIGATAPAQLPLLLSVLVTPVTSSISAAVSAAMSATIYLELRRVKEGVGVAQLAAVFS